MLCCYLADNKSVLKICISTHFHEVTGFLLWIGTYCIHCVVCVVQQRKRVKDLFSPVGYNESCLAAIRHVKSIIRVAPSKYTLPQCLVKNNSTSLEFLRGNKLYYVAIFILSCMIISSFATS